MRSSDETLAQSHNPEGSASNHQGLAYSTLSRTGRGDVGAMDSRMRSRPSPEESGAVWRWPLTRDSPPPEVLPPPQAPCADPTAVVEDSKINAQLSYLSWAQRWPYPNECNSPPCSLPGTWKSKECCATALKWRTLPVPGRRGLKVI
ncbi:histone-lysine N-methyltransferase SETDB2-like [Grus japonensis]|uniref:Histone-lysine N-methyltransferase SETDB2-like n=1 Tax=Grus japonensis TaxID=30415 RepID=A0ABC9W3N3_GRUJA